jgi:hypothetical protein
MHALWQFNLHLLRRLYRPHHAAVHHKGLGQDEPHFQGYAAKGRLL